MNSRLLCWTCNWPCVAAAFATAIAATLSARAFPVAAVLHGLPLLRLPLLLGLGLATRLPVRLVGLELKSPELITLRLTPVRIADALALGLGGLTGALGPKLARWAFRSRCRQSRVRLTEPRRRAIRAL